LAEELADVSWEKEQMSFDQDFKDSNRFGKRLSSEIKRANLKGERPTIEVVNAMYGLAFLADQLGAPDVSDEWVALISVLCGSSASVDGWRTREAHTQRLIQARLGLPDERKEKQQIEGRS